MKVSFTCPKCSAHLNIKENIILTVRKKNKQKAMVLLSPELGNYDIYYHSESVKFDKDEEVDFLCPVCSGNLPTHKKNKNLVHLIMIEPDGKKADVFFSKRFGEKATYKVSDKNIDKYGKDSDSNTFWSYSL